MHTDISYTHHLSYRHLLYSTSWILTSSIPNIFYTQHLAYWHLIYPASCIPTSCIPNIFYTQHLVNWHLAYQNHAYWYLVYPSSFIPTSCILASHIPNVLYTDILYNQHLADTHFIYRKAKNRATWLKLCSVHYPSSWVFLIKILLFGLIELDHQMPVSCGGYPRTPQKMLLLQAPEYGATKVVGTIVGIPTDHGWPVSMKLVPLLSLACNIETANID